MPKSIVSGCFTSEKMNTCWYNENALEIEGNPPKKYGQCDTMTRPPIAGCPCGRHSWSTKEERRLKSLKCLEHRHLGYMNQLRKTQWNTIEMKPDLKRDTLAGDDVKTCRPTAMKPPEEYPVILSPYSLCWWEQPDSVVPPLCTGLISRYGYKYRVPKATPTCGQYQPLKLMPIIQPAKRPTFDRVPRNMQKYWDICPGRTEYEDSISFTGYIILRGAKQYIEPIPSCRRRKEDHPF